LALLTASVTLLVGAGSTRSELLLGQSSVTPLVGAGSIRSEVVLLGLGEVV